MLAIGLFFGNLANTLLNRTSTPPSESYLFLTSDGTNFITADGNTLEYFH